MPTYALLGATGGTGSAILRHLLFNPPQDLTLNIFVRSSSKLHTAFPTLLDSVPFKLTVTEGSISDATVLQKCLKDADLIIACIGTNYPTPGLTVSQDTAKAIISALESRRREEGDSYKAPTVIQLRTASLNPEFSAAFPWIGKKLLWFCLFYVYDDLDRACKLLQRAAAPGADSRASAGGLLHYIFVDPPGLMDVDGTTATGHKLITGGKQEPMMNYADLGVAFCEVAERREEFVDGAVGVTATGEVRQTPGALLGFLATGLKGRLWG